MFSDGKLYDWWYDTDPASREVVAPVFMKTAEGAVRGTEFDYTNPTVVNASGEKHSSCYVFRKYIAGMPKRQGVRERSMIRRSKF